jgi:hypothetical protein
LQSNILVSVSNFILPFSEASAADRWLLQAFKYVFTSPSSVDKEPKATHLGNARIHGMKSTTPASITYIATQVCLLIRRCKFS